MNGPADMCMLFLQVSQVLQGREVCVMNGPADLPKCELERKVVEMGGTFVQNPGQ